MTKRIFAAVLAIVLVVTTLAIPAFASPSGASLVKDSGSNKLTATWSPVTGANIYEVKFYRDDVVAYSTNVTVTSATNTAEMCTVTYTPSTGGNYTVQVGARETANGAYMALYTSNPVSIPITGTGSGGIQISGSGNTTTVSWDNDGYSINYYVQYVTADGTSGQYVTAGDGDRSSVTISTSISNIKSITVYRANNNQTAYSGIIGSWTNNGSSGGNTGSGNITQNNITISINGNYVVVSWQPLAYATRYQVAYRTSPTANYTYVDSTTGTASFPYIAGQTYQIAVAGNVNGSWVTIGSGAIYGSSTGGGTVTGNVVATRNSASSSQVYLTWQASSSSTMYIINCSRSGAATTQQFANTNSTVINCDPNYDWSFVVTTIDGQTVGYAVLTRGSTSSLTGSGSVGGTNSLTINRGYNSSTVSWPAVYGAVGYIVIHRGSNTSTLNEVVTNNSITLNYGTNDTWSVSVQAIMSTNQFVTVGSATVTPSGITQGGSSSSSNVTQGSNCTVTSYANYAYLTWNANGRSPYTVIYYLNGDTSQGQVRQTSTNSIQLNVSNTYSYTVIVIDSTNNIIASASVKAGSSSGSGSGTTGDITESEVVNLTATPKNGWQTTISWNSRSDAVAYIVMYGLLNSTASEQTYAYGTSVDIPFSSARPYQVYVYAQTATGRTYEVGHIFNVPGSTPDTDDDTVKDYVTNFKATSGNKKVTLSWNAADGADSYTIYYRRANSSTWLRAGTISRTAVNITGLTNGIKYQFMVTANGNQSGIVEIAPSASGSTTVVAPDPDGDDDNVTVGNELRLTSVTSTSSGTITASWTSASGATSYRVYVAEGSSSTYRNKGTFTGTTAVISGLKSGTTYKVRVLKLPVEGDTATALAACDYMQVTVR